MNAGPESNQETETGGVSSQDHSTETRPWSKSATFLKTASVTSRSVAAQPTQRSTIFTSTLSPLRRSLTFNPQSGFALGFEPVEAASYRICDTAQIMSESVLV